MARSNWLRTHRLLAFFLLAFAISWSSWIPYALGLMPKMEFLAIGPLLAALIVVPIAEGRAGLKVWARRLIRWRVSWAWYAVALLGPVLLVGLAGAASVVLGGSASGLGQLSASALATTFALRLVNPLDGALGEEPGFRGYALPLLQRRRSPLVSATILGALVTAWHLPLVLFEGLGPLAFPTTFAITFLYVWLFNRTGGSVLLTVLFHASQGTVTMQAFGFSAADHSRTELIYLVIVVLAVLATLFDRPAWRSAPRSAVDPVPVRPTLVGPVGAL